MQTANYSIVSDGQRGRVVRDSDGVEIPQDADDQRFCDFLTWASRQRPAVEGFEFERPWEFFSDARHLIRRFCDNGAMLFVENADESDDRHKRRVARSGPAMDLGGRILHRLSRGVARAEEGETDFEPGGIAPSPSSVYVTEGLLRELDLALTDETSDVRRASTWPVRRTFVYVDISDFSQLRPGQQALVVNALGFLAANRRFWRSELEREAIDDIETTLSIGDGYIYCFRRTALAVYFAARLAATIELCVARRTVPVEFHFRMGVHVGPVYHFRDHGRNGWNYVGDGINGGCRVLDAIGKGADDLVFVSSQVREELLAAERDSRPNAEILAALGNRGRRPDKHGKMWRVYEINHAVIGE